jgi:hypothetical protein
MLYVITNHNIQNFVVLGPIQWKPRYFSNIVSEEIGEDVTITDADKDRVPFDIVPGVTIRTCDVVHSIEENYNGKIHHMQGPIWTYNEDGTATATWYQENKNIDLVKGELKNIVAANRYEKEVSGFVATVCDKQVFLDTSRERRDAFQSKYLIMSDDETINWKFSNGTLELSKENVLNIIMLINNHIQEWFDWEISKIAEISACTTLQELNLIELRTNPEEESDDNPPTLLEPI